MADLPINIRSVLPAKPYIYRLTLSEYVAQVVTVYGVYHPLSAFRIRDRKIRTRTRESNGIKPILAVNLSGLVQPNAMLSLGIYPVNYYIKLQRFAKVMAAVTKSDNHCF